MIKTEDRELKENQRGAGGQPGADNNLEFQAEAEPDDQGQIPPDDNGAGDGGEIPLDGASQLNRN